MTKNIFRGENAILDFINPQNFLSPMVELDPELNPYKKDGVRIFAKLLNSLPLTNVKSIPAFGMLQDAKQKKLLEGVDTIVENSSGNTVFSLAVIGRLMGIENTKAFVSNEVTAGKLKLLQLFGVQPIVNQEPICPDPADKTSGIYKAKILAEEKNIFNPGQYDNFSNPESHYKITGPQIFSQLDGDIQIMAGGLGTTGTMHGIGKFLKEKNQNILNIGVVRSPNNPVPGPRTRNLLNQIAFDWEKTMDEVIEIGTLDSYKTSLELIRKGLVVGPSSGFGLAGLLKFLKLKKSENGLENLKNENGEINCCFICCDSPYPYLDEYFKYLDESYFPEIENKNLLQSQVSFEKKSNMDFSINVQDAFEKMYGKDIQKAWQDIENGNIKMNENIILLDCRSQKDFEHFQLAGSQNIEIENFDEKILDRQKEILIICKYGAKL